MFWSARIFACFLFVCLLVYTERERGRVVERGKERR